MQTLQATIHHQLKSRFQITFYQLVSLPPIVMLTLKPHHVRQLRLLTVHHCATRGLSPSIRGHFFIATSRRLQLRWARATLPARRPAAADDGGNQGLFRSGLRANMREDIQGSWVWDATSLRPGGFTQIPSQATQTLVSQRTGMSIIGVPCHSPVFRPITNFFYMAYPCVPKVYGAYMCKKNIPNSLIDH